MNSSSISLIYCCALLMNTVALAETPPPNAPGQNSHPAAVPLAEALLKAGWPRVRTGLQESGVRHILVDNRESNLPPLDLIEKVAPAEPQPESAKVGRKGKDEQLQFKALKTENEKLKLKIAELSRRVAKAETEKNHNEQGLANLEKVQGSATKAIGELESLQKRLAIAEKQTSAASKSLEAALSDLQTLDSENEKLSDELNKLKDFPTRTPAMAEQAQKIITLAQENAALQARLTSVTEDAKKEIEQSATRVSKLIAEVAKLKTGQTQAMQAQTSAAQESLEKEKAALKTELAKTAETARTALAQRKTENELSVARIAHLLARIGQLSQQSEIALKEMNASRATAAQAATLREENSRLQDEMKKLRQMAASEVWQKKLEALNQEKSQTAAELQKALAVSDRMKADLQRSTVQLKDLKTQVETSQRRESDLQSNLTALKAERDEMAQSLKHHVVEQLKTDQARLQSELKTARDTAEKQKAALSKMESLEKEKNALVEELKKLKADFQKAEGDLKARVEKDASMSEQILTLRALQKDHETLTRESTRQLSEARKLAQEQKDRADALEKEKQSIAGQLAAMENLKKEQATLARQFSDLKASSAAASKTWSEQLKDLQAALDAAKKQESLTSARAKSAEEESRRLTEEVKKSTAQIKTYAPMQHENDKLSAEIIALRATHGADLRKAQEKLNDAFKNEAALQAKIKKSSADIISFSMEIAMLKEESVAAAENLKKLAASLEAEKKSAAAMAEKVKNTDEISRRLTEAQAKAERAQNQTAQLTTKLGEHQASIKALNDALAMAKEAQAKTMNSFHALSQAHQASVAQLVEFGTLKATHANVSAELTSLKARSVERETQIASMVKQSNESLSSISQEMDKIKTMSSQTAAALQNLTRDHEKTEKVLNETRKTTLDLQKERDSLTAEVARLQKLVGATRETLTQIDPVFITDQASGFDKTHQERVLRQAKQILGIFPNAKFRVIGHTDPQGDAQSEEQLSLGRAQNFARYLAENGIDPARLESVGKGSTLPLAGNGTAQRCSRVEVAVITD